MDIGLDDFIRKNKAAFNNGTKRRSRNRNLQIKGNVKSKDDVKPKIKKSVLNDLRGILANKTKPKTTVRDAREKLNRVQQRDARSKILRREPAHRINAPSKRTLSTKPISLSTKRVNPGGMHLQAHMDIEEARKKQIRRRTSDLLCRTVSNDTSYDNAFNMNNDMYMDQREFADYEPRLKINVPGVIDHRLRRPPVENDRYYYDQEYHVPVTPQGPPITPSRREILKSRLEPASPIQTRHSPVSQTQGYRIVVSNLQPSVTHEDIKELFEDIGMLLSSRVVRPGTAEVVYKTMEDAITAVDTYHNRQLDGQPMKCLLVKPSNAAKNVGNTKNAIIPDLHAIHKALFTR